MAKFVLNLVLIFPLLVPLSEQYSKKCDKLGIHFYELLGCKIEKTKYGCPVKYRCPKYKLSNDTCTIGGEEIENGQEIPGTSNCLWCYCEPAYDGGIFQFPCAMPRCFPPLIQNNSCYPKMELDSCCPSEAYCPDSTTETCVVDGKKYTEYQIMRPNDTCLECVCKKGFELYEKPYCRRTPCDLEVTYFKYLEKDCTPFYNDLVALCCPAGYICDDAVKGVDEIKITSPCSGVNCVFNGKTYPHHSKFVAEFTYNNVDYTANCECKVAPHPTCIVE